MEVKTQVCSVIWCLPGHTEALFTGDYEEGQLRLAPNGLDVILDML